MHGQNPAKLGPILHSEAYDIFLCFLPSCSHNKMPTDAPKSPLASRTTTPQLLGLVGVMIMYFAVLLITIACFLFLN